MEQKTEAASSRIDGRAHRARWIIVQRVIIRSIGNDVIGFVDAILELKADFQLHGPLWLSCFQCDSIVTERLTIVIEHAIFHGETKRLRIETENSSNSLFQFSYCRAFGHIGKDGLVLASDL